MSSADRTPLVLGRVKGHRGSHGEVTVTVFSGEATRWVHLDRVVLSGSSSGARAESRRVESARAYRDKLVLKFAGIDDANRASALRGCEVSALPDDVPELPADSYWVERLVGTKVQDSVLGDIGCVMDVVKTAGADLLLVRDAAGVETLVPLVREYVVAIDNGNGPIQVSLPRGLHGLNEHHGRETA